MASARLQRSATAGPGSDGHIGWMWITNGGHTCASLSRKDVMNVSFRSLMAASLPVAQLMAAAETRCTLGKDDTNML